MNSNALTQYINLFTEHRQVIDSNSAEAINALRPAALEALTAAGRLPEKGDEGYERTSVNAMFAPDFGVNIGRVNMPVNVGASFKCGVPNLSTLLAVVVNDRFAPTSTLLANLPEGVTVCSLAAAAKEWPELVQKYYGSVANMADPSTALNTLLVQDGVFIHVRRGVQLEKALQIVSIAAPGETPLLSARRVLVVAEDGAKVQILKCDHTQGDTVANLSSEVVEIVAAPHSLVDWYELEEANASSARRSQLYVRQLEGSDVNICGATLTNGTTRNDYIIDLDGPHTTTLLSAMAIGTDTQHIDNASTLRHRAHHGHSRQLFKYTLSDSATGAFEGGIEVGHGSRFVEAYQTNRNILDSTSARMHTKPQLLIYNDDVKCSHGASTGQLDPAAIFYMQARGIPKAEARKMLMQAFMVDVIDNIRLEPLRDRLRHMVDRRFSGHRASCADCSC